MILEEIYKAYPTQQDCIKHLELTIWNNKPNCPYCQSFNISPIKNELRYHCNGCNTSFSVTVKTVFHKTKIELQKWFYVIWVVNNDKRLSARSLGNLIGVTKDTALKMLNRIHKEILTQNDLIKKII
jgi:transposase-like protein